VTLLGLYGAGGTHTDVGAHATGFAAGLVFGFAAALPRRVFDGMPCGLRPATAQDKKFLATLHERCYREVVLAQFGSWDEKLQRGFFEKKWDPARWQIATVQGTDIGAVSVQRHPDHVFLAEILIDPRFQNQGFGTELLRQIFGDAAKDALPVRLQVLRRNRAYRLYERLGFVQTGQTDTHILMERTSRASI
jgi:ribosomal protein S18 acetylase RimI-like enzyme